MRHSTIRLVHPGDGDRRVQAFAPGRVNLIGEHTDYNDGLCLPLAIERGVTVTATPAAGPEVEARALDLKETAHIELAPAPVEDEGWRCFLRGAIAELTKAGIPPRPCRIEITGNLPRDAGLSSSAALCVSLCLALCAISDAEAPSRIELARLCSRVENDWCGAETGLLDQLAVLCAERGHAVRIDMRGPTLEQVPLALEDHFLVTLDSGAPRELAGSGYNERRAECRAAARALGVESLRDASDAKGLPDPLDRRVRHVLSENARVDAAVAALRARDPAALGELLDASHRSLRDDYEVSVSEVEHAVEACHEAGALGARLVGGGFGGSVLALFPPGAEPPAKAIRVVPGGPARLR